MPVPPLMQMIRELIGQPSVSSVNPAWDQSNRGVIDLLAQWLEALHFRVEVLPVPDRDGKFNLVANRGSGADGLVLSGHTDTVPFDGHRWSRDPFELSERNGRLYGLGCADMKAFFALAIEGIRGLPLDKLRRPLTLIATADEESTMCGARSLAAMGQRLGRHALIGEPTNLRPVRLHKGIAMASIRVTGRSGHSSDPALGRNALEGMYRVIGELLAWRDEIQKRQRNELFKVPVATANLGHIHGGDNPNRICGECELQIDLRPLPGMDSDRLLAELDQRLHSLLEDSGMRVEMASLFPAVPAMETSATAAIVEAVEQMTGYPASAVAFGTEGPFLNGMGMETVILGPGSVEQAHQPDEYLATDQIKPCTELLRSLVRRFCLTQ